MRNFDIWFRFKRATWDPNEAFGHSMTSKEVWERTYQPLTTRLFSEEYELQINYSRHQLIADLVNFFQPCDEVSGFPQ